MGVQRGQMGGEPHIDTFRVLRHPQYEHQADMFAKAGSATVFL